MSTTSLSAYAAWLAKHETKANRRKRSASPVEEEKRVDMREETEERSTEQDPPRPWIGSKTKKVLSGCASLESPDAIEALVANRDVEPLELRGQTRSHDTMSACRATETETATNGKGRKRRGEYCESSTRTKEKRAKKVSTEPSRTVTATPSTCPTTSSLSPQQSSKNEEQTKDDIASIKVLRPSRPVLDEARYWADVDRFSFLA